MWLFFVLTHETSPPACYLQATSTKKSRRSGGNTTKDKENDVTPKTPASARGTGGNIISPPTSHDEVEEEEVPTGAEEPEAPAPAEDEAVQPPEPEPEAPAPAEHEAVQQEPEPPEPEPEAPAPAEHEAVQQEPEPEALEQQEHEPEALEVPFDVPPIVDGSSSIIVGGSLTRNKCQALGSISFQSKKLLFVKAPLISKAELVFGSTAQVKVCEDSQNLLPENCWRQFWNDSAVPAILKNLRNCKSSFTSKAKDAFMEAISNITTASGILMVVPAPEDIFPSEVFKKGMFLLLLCLLHNTTISHLYSFTSFPSL